MVTISALNFVNFVLINAEIELIEDEFTEETFSLYSCTWVVPVFIGGNVMLDSFPLDSDSSTIKIAVNCWITNNRYF